MNIITIIIMLLYILLLFVRQNTQIYKSNNKDNTYLTKKF